MQKRFYQIKSAFNKCSRIIPEIVMILTKNTLQERAIGLFSDALVRKGFLGLGAKESLHFSPHAVNFTEFQSKDRIYQKVAMKELMPPRVRALIKL